MSARLGSLVWFNNRTRQLRWLRSRIDRLDVLVAVALQVRRSARPTNVEGSRLGLGRADNARQKGWSAIHRFAWQVAYQTLENLNPESLKFVTADTTFQCGRTPRARIWQRIKFFVGVIVNQQLFAIDVSVWPVPHRPYSRR